MPLYPYPQEQPRCPVDVLPEPCRSAAFYALSETEAPPSVVMTDLIAAMAAVVHCGYDCEAPNGARMPTTINTCALADTGIGKGESLKVFFKLFLDAFQLDLPNSPEPSEHDSGPPPVATGFTKFLTKKISYVALIEELDGYRRNLTIQREEGHSFLQTSLFKDDADGLAQLWSGNPPLDHSVRGTRLTAVDARCSVGFRIQPIFMYDYLRKNPLIYKLGFWPRAIAGCHDPARFPEHSTGQIIPKGQFTSSGFLSRMRALAALLNEKPPGQHPRTLVKLSLEAKAFMLELNHLIKGWGDAFYPDIGEAVRRAWENTLRLGTVLHVFCVGKGEVSRDMLEKAWAIVQWSLYQHQLIFVDAMKQTSEKPRATASLFSSTPLVALPRSPRLPKPPRPMQDANWILECIHTLMRSTCRPYALMDDVITLSGLTGRRLAAAMSWLLLQRRVIRSARGDLVLLQPQPIYLQQSGMSAI